jgi:hypothetical protein
VQPSREVKQGHLLPLDLGLSRNPAEVIRLITLLVEPIPAPRSAVIASSAAVTAG